MITLYGFPASNYVNMVHLALLEKGVAHDFVLTYPDQSDALLTKSPRGKLPCLGTPEGYLNETSVILDYLEEAAGGKPLLPADPYARARVRALMKEIELYIELPARSVYPEMFFGVALPGAVKKLARENLIAGFQTLARHGRFSPYVAGDTFTLADIFFLYSVDLAAKVGTGLLDVDLLALVPGAADLLTRLNAMPNVQQLAVSRHAALPGFVAAMKAKLAAG
jgi:glutathione S-transferase